MSRLWRFAAVGIMLIVAGLDCFSPCWPGVRSSSQGAVVPASFHPDLNAQQRGNPFATLSADPHAVARSRPLCIAASHWSAGKLGATILYRLHAEADRIEVGYFVYWSTERPWGANSFSIALVPALLTDAFYSHFLFVFPGLRRLWYGPGDVEGARITYERTPRGWIPVSVIADDGSHREVRMGAEEFLDESGRIVLLTEVWSHQLGGRNAARSVSLGASMTCFDANAVRPLTEEDAAAFRLGSPTDPLRAPPAWGMDRYGSSASR